MVNTKVEDKSQDIIKIENESQGIKMEDIM